MPIDQTSFLTPVRTPIMAKRTTPPERVMQRRISADGTVTQTVSGSDGTTAAVTEKPPSPFDLFGDLGRTQAADRHPEQEQARQAAQEHALASARYQARILADENRTASTKEECAQEHAAAEESSGQPEQPDAPPSAPAAAYRQGMEGPPQPGRMASAPTPPKNGEAGASRLTDLVSQLSKRLSVQDSKAEISLDSVMKEFTGTRVAFQQRGNSLHVACTCETAEDIAWFDQHARTLCSRLAAQLRRPVELIIERQGAARADEPQVARHDQSAQ